jgi:hypothetical protein
MSVYYLGRTARITDTIIESKCPAYQSFPIRELTHIHTVRRDPIEAMTASIPVQVCSVAVSGIGVLVALAGWPLLDRPLVTVIGAIGLAGALMVATASARARRRPQEIRAVHRGRLVCLFRSSDLLVLGQVRRALLRALDATNTMVG